MNSLNLPNPKMMDVAIPANMKVGYMQEEIASRGWAFSADQALGLIGQPDVALIDLRERSERERHGVIPGSLHVPYPDLAGKHQRWRHAARAREVDQQAHPVLLRVRRALGDGGAGRAGRWDCLGLPHPGRHGRLEAGQGAARPLNEAAGGCSAAGRVVDYFTPNPARLIASALATESASNMLRNAAPGR